METLLVITFTLGIVSADIGIGYNYKVPHTSYGVPSYQTGSNSLYNTGYTGSSVGYRGQSSSQGGDLDSFSPPKFGYTPGSHAINPIGGSFGGAGYQTGSGYQTGGGLGSNYYQAGGSNTGFSSNTASVAQHGFQYHNSNQYQSAAAEKYHEFYNELRHQPPQVFKHFYVHAAPEDPEPARPRQPIVLPPPQKHYKIIFIKTPSPPAYTPQYIPVQQPNEEKTIVYVLVGKPDEQQDIVLPKVENRPPSKPEVFFIKYNSKEDSQAVINDIVNDYKSGESVNLASAGISSGASSVSQTGGQTGASESGQLTHSGATGQYSHPGLGQYSQSTSGVFGDQSSGQAIGTQTGSEASTSSFGAQSFGISDESSSAASVASVDSSATSGIVASTFSSSSAVTAAANFFDNVNALSTSQGVPHETYGPPKFRV